jgi:hypothetical protein
VFSCCDYVEYGPGRLGRINHILVHELRRERQPFLILSEVIQTGARDDVLDLPLLELKHEGELIVGLPSIRPTRLYVVDVGSGVVLVEWDIKQL